ncbi:response regulator transcription factor [Gorillibacterium sp. sgz5001074]|uniref:response regulator transcription factor n=1 Tax=Gorillibacterium sp. sgz5001074 TaxID=3446695 RepID=UPI003F66BE22
MGAHILLVDDHRTFLAGTAMILEKHGFRTTTAAGGREALERMEEAGAAFDLYVYDLKLPEMNGFELTEATLAIQPDATIVILTGEELPEHYDRLMVLGVTGILEKSMGEEEFVMSLRLALRRMTVLPLPLARQLRTKTAGGDGGTDGIPGADAAGLMPPGGKELDVLRLIAQGHKNKDIAAKLFMSQRNVEYLISRLFDRLGVQSRQDAVMKGIERGWLKLDA